MSVRREAIADGVTAVLVDVPELYDRAGLYGADGRDFPDNALRFAVLGRAALEYARLKASGPPSYSRARLADRTRARSTRRCTSSNDPIVGGVPVRLHDPQPGVPGSLSRLRAAGARARARNCCTQSARVLGQHQLPQGGRQLQREDHDGEPDLRAGDPDAGVRVRLPRRPAAARRRSGRNPQRHRHRALESRDRCLRRRRRFTRDDLDGKARREAGAARAGRPARRPRRLAPAGDRRDLPADRSEGLRPDRRGGGAADGARRHVGDARQRRARTTRTCGGRLAARHPDRVVGHASASTNAWRT